MGTTLDHGYFKDVQFINCNLEMVNINEAKLDSVNFIDSDLKNMNYLQNNNKRIKFQNCQIEGLDFTGSKMNHFDLSTCEFDSINALTTDLIGCTFNSEQTNYLALKYLQIKIK
jgi:hypothetical protein